MNKQSPETLSVIECHQLTAQLLVREGTPRQFRLGVRNYTMGLLMLDAGLRVGEVVKLLQSDLILNGEPMLNLLVRCEVAKTHEERTVPLSARLRDAIKTMQEKWWPIVMKDGKDYAFFNDKTCRPLTTRQVERIVEAAAVKAFGRKVNPHRLRHTFGSKAMRVTNARVVQDLLGHKQLSSTQIYTHPNEDDKQKAIDRLSCEETEQNSQNT